MKPPSRLHDGAACRRLLTAIIRRAILDFVLYKDCDPKTEEQNYTLAADAAGWLFSDDAEECDPQGRYTFLFICYLLELNPRVIRDHVLTMKRTDVNRFSGNAEEI